MSTAAMESTRINWVSLCETEEHQFHYISAVISLHLVIALEKSDKWNNSELTELNYNITCRIKRRLNIIYVQLTKLKSRIVNMMTWLYFPYYKV
jgi:hypothetical protein